MNDSSRTNDAQIEFWNGKAADAWVDNQMRMDEMLEPLNTAALEIASAAGGETVLDIGCGCGASTLAIAATGARVTGVDISAPMLAHARTRVEGQEGVNFVQADASSHVFSDEHDLLFSRFGVMFFADPAAAFENLRHALKPGGRLCFLCWQEPRRNPWVAVPMAAVLQFVAPPEPMPEGAPGPFAFADSAKVVGILQQAGFADVTATPIEAMLRLGGAIGDAAELMEKLGPTSRLLAESDESTRTRVRESVASALAPHQSDGGVQLGAACWAYQARNPH